MITHAVLWIDTDGKFYVNNFESEDTAESVATVTADSGLPVQVIEKREFIRGVIER